MHEVTKLLEEAAHANPRDPRIPYLQGVVAEQLGQVEAMREAYTRFLAIAPRRFEAQKVEARKRIEAPGS